MIGIFGGTFNPIHFGHLRAALEIKEALALTEVRFIPSANPPHRQQPKVSATLRLTMLQLAIQQQSGFVTDDRELKRKGPSYMVDTLQSLRQDFPQQSLLLCIGTDAFNHLTSWYHWQDLFNYAHIVVMTRPDFCTPPLPDFFANKLITDKATLQKQLAGKLYFQRITQLSISSTAIRHMIAEGKQANFLLPDSVITVINQRKLYQS